ncbi:MAG: AGCS family alanine or glycine:cation symporter, partial [Gammaproteobacteria bacterium]
MASRRGPTCSEKGKIPSCPSRIYSRIFVVIGAAANLGPVIDFSDAAIFAMAVVNITALYCLLGVVKKELTSYSS